MPIKIQQGDSVDGSAGINFHFNMQNTASLNKVQAPWGGEVLAKDSYGDKNVFKILHDKNVQSMISFTGKSQKLNPGDRVKAGELIGNVSDETKSVLWSVRLKSKSAENA